MTHRCDSVYLKVRCRLDSGHDGFHKWWRAGLYPHKWVEWVTGS